MNLEQYASTVLISALMLTWWFMTPVPVRLTKLLRWFGWKEKDPDFWPSRIDYKYWTRDEWEEWLLDNQSVPPLLREGLVCPWCLALHFSYIAGTVAALWNGCNLLDILKCAILSSVLVPGNALIIFFITKLLFLESHGTKD